MQRLDSRPSCPRCVWKHLSSALILGGEYLSEDSDGSRPYKDHLFFMNGHLSQAEEQSARNYPEMSRKIREVRLRLENAKFDGLHPALHVVTVEDVEEILQLGGMGMDGLPLEETPSVLVVEPIALDSVDPVEEEPLPPIAPAKKMSRDEAEYVVLGTPEAFCENCQNWAGLDASSKATGNCSLVNGKLFLRGSCSLFEPKKK